MQSLAVHYIKYALAKNVMPHFFTKCVSQWYVKFTNSLSCPLRDENGSKDGPYIYNSQCYFKWKKEIMDFFQESLCNSGCQIK